MVKRRPTITADGARVGVDRSPAAADRRQDHDAVNGNGSGRTVKDSGASVTGYGVILNRFGVTWSWMRIERELELNGREVESNEAGADADAVSTAT
jgi:hypothetical protein